jgi:ABC-type Fe3+-hydroxamate transport system substrate-binding protein
VAFSPVRLAGAAAFAAALLACGREEAPRRASPAARVVSLSPAFTELIFALDAGDRLVGRTAWCDHPPEAARVPSVGDGLNPNIEAVAARAPDLVVLYASTANGPATARLRALGIPTRTLPLDRLADVPAAARALGPALGIAARAESAAATFAAALDSARAAARPLVGARLLLLAWDQPPVVIGGGSFQHELVTLAGGENVFGDVVQPSAQVTIETIAARDPDLVLLLDPQAAPSWADRPEWRAVRAVRERRFVQVTGSAFSRPTLRALEAARALRAQLEAALR